MQPQIENEKTVKASVCAANIFMCIVELFMTFLFIKNRAGVDITSLALVVEQRLSICGSQNVNGNRVSYCFYLFNKFFLIFNENDSR